MILYLTESQSFVSLSAAPASSDSIEIDSFAGIDMAKAIAVLTGKWIIFEKDLTLNLQATDEQMNYDVGLTTQ